MAMEKFGYVISFLITWCGMPFRVSASRQRGSQIVTFEIHFVIGILERLGFLRRLIRNKILRVLHEAAMASYPQILDHTKEDGEGVLIDQPLAPCQVVSRVSFVYGNENFGYLWAMALKRAGYKPRDCRIEATVGGKITMGFLLQYRVNRTKPE